MLEKGTTFADYRVDGLLGRGGMGTVYEATQLSLHRRVALKVLAPHLSDDAAFRRRFRREGEAQAALVHDHIVTVYEAGETEYGLFLSMQLVRGCTLKDLVLAKQLDPSRTMRLLIPIADALDTAHTAGLIHRDIKPQNILVDGLGHSYLADFGLMKARTAASLTEPGHFIGTCDYVSPEQICGGRAGKQSDLYSLAAVLYECLSGVAPYPKDSEVAVLYAHVHDRPPRITAVRPELPANLDEVIGRGMAKAPEDRHGSAAEFMSEVERTLAGDAVAVCPQAIPAPVHQSAFAGSAHPTIPLVASPARRRTLGPRPAMLAAAGLMILTAAGFLAGRAVSEGSPTAPVTAGVERDYAGAMRQTIRALDHARRAGRSRLAAARTPTGQASAASALAGSYRTGARTVAGLAAGPSGQPARTVVAGALTRAATGYTTMASAARQGTSQRYDRGRNTVRGSERALRRELERLADNDPAPR